MCAYASDSDGENGVIIIQVQRRGIRRVGAWYDGYYWIMRWCLCRIREQVQGLMGERRSVCFGGAAVVAVVGIGIIVIICSGWGRTTALDVMVVVVVAIAGY